MAKSFRKLDPQKVFKLKQQGLSNALIAERLGVTQGAIYHVLRKTPVCHENQVTEAGTPLPSGSFS
ncbi:MAG: hypothetical protein OEM83_09735 [Gammaproteobacteria bacterium]|nr:hypothetical protein [Gammaproteobacteria bacterium]MDH5513374.1 hypothetical protein [Gammaproteobacteria bacterium]